MNKYLYVLLILCVWLSVNSCGKKDSASTATSTESVIIFPYSTDTQYAYNAHKVAYGCSGTDSSGYTRAPFFSTSTHDLKDRLPSSKWSYPVYSVQGHKISSTWENLWDGNIDMSLHEAEVIYDNESSISRGLWTGTKSDGTFSGRNCNDWSHTSASDNATNGTFQAKDSSDWIDNSTSSCYYTGSNYFLCFMYN